MHTLSNIRRLIKQSDVLYIKIRRLNIWDRRRFYITKQSYQTSGTPHRRLKCRPNVLTDVYLGDSTCTACRTSEYVVRRRRDRLTGKADDPVTLNENPGRSVCRNRTSNIIFRRLLCRLSKKSDDNLENKSFCWGGFLQKSDVYIIISRLIIRLMNKTDVSLK
jgi:hypothetical protein